MKKQTKQTKQTKQAERVKPRQRDVLLVLREPLLGWVEGKAARRGEAHLQPTITDLLHKQRDSEKS